jgi:VWFA-related protein
VTSPLRVLVALLAGAAAGAASSPVPAQEPQVFPGGIELVTVDVVVADKQGNPVEGLSRDDFTVLDEGRPQELATFDRVRATAEPPAAGGPSPPRPRMATNLARPAERGRLFVIVFDDMHLSPMNAQRAKAAVLEFLTRGTREGDQVALVATGGGAWWSTRLPEGRADLIAVLKHLEGRRVPENAMERLTDYEAMRIFVYRDPEVAARVQDRFDRYGTRSRREMQESLQQQAGQTMAGMLDPYVEMRASEDYLRLKSRLEITLGLLDRTAKALAESRDRKAVLLVSEGFVYDTSIDAFKRVKESARRANAVFYFLDARGLEGISSFSAEFGPALLERDMMSAIADISREGDGAAGLAEDTGGFAVRSTNDLRPGAERIGRESRSYYLLGYNPGAIPRDGRFRKIEVRVRGKGLTVRARRGYYAPGDDGKGAPPAPSRLDPAIQQALDAPGSEGAIPLRLTAYAADEASLGKARVLVVGEADLSQVAFPEGTGGAIAALDTLVVVAHRESGDFQRRDQRVELQRNPRAPAGPVWYTFVREFELPAGVHQAKLVVRDANSQRIGTLLFEFEVPPLDRLRVSTPILGDRLQGPAGQAGSTPLLQVTRNFASGGTLYCRFDVYGATRGKDGLPRVASGYELRRTGGRVIGRSAPTPIQPTSIGAIARLLQIPLANVGPGDYELVVTVRDQASGESRELDEPFSLGAPRP